MKKSEIKLAIDCCSYYISEYVKLKNKLRNKTYVPTKEDEVQIRAMIAITELTGLINEIKNKNK